MTKRKTKAQRELEQKAALRQRIHDIAVGAGVDDVVEDDYWCIDPESLCRLLIAARHIFVTDGNEYLFKAYSIDKYTCLDNLTDFYYRNGVRA